MKMFKDNNQAMIQDINGKTPLFFDINFDRKDIDCVRISLANGHRRIIKYSDLFGFMFVLATPEQQAKMIPVKQELGYQYMKQIRVKVSKNIKKGEELVVNVPINVPQIIEDSIIKGKKIPNLTGIKEGITI